jgi:sugar lactone lactonase YvrE
MKKLISLLMIPSLVSAASYGQAPLHSDSLIRVASFGKSMAIGLSVTSDNRVFVSFPNHNGDGSLALAEEKNGHIYPYPNRTWNAKKGSYNVHFLRVQDLYVDANDNLWVLDSKPDSRQGGKFKLVKVNTRTNKVAKAYLFEGLDKSRSALNDVRIDLKRNLAYLSDPGQAAIVVLNLASGKTRTVLGNTSFTLADPIVLKYAGIEMKNENGKPFSSNVNGIALTHDFKYLYFKPINKEDLYRISTAYLAESALPEKELESKVEDMGKVGITHGLIADKAGNIYLSTSEDYSISYLSPDGKLHTLVRDRRILWPDSMGIGSDGYLYFSCSQLQLLPEWNNGVDKTEYPYRIFKVRLPKS